MRPEASCASCGLHAEPSDYDVGVASGLAGWRAWAARTRLESRIHHYKRCGLGPWALGWVSFPGWNHSSAAAWPLGPALRRVAPDTVLPSRGLHLCLPLVETGGWRARHKHMTPSAAEPLALPPDLAASFISCPLVIDENDHRAPTVRPDLHYPVHCPSQSALTAHLRVRSCTSL